MAAREIESPFAYREAERHIHALFGRKALSATFDRLGNAATVAQVHALQWARRHGLAIVPFERDVGGHVALEVYPALLKQRRSGLPLPSVAELLPDGVVPGTDACDAALCALHALAYALDGYSMLPALCGPPEATAVETVATEGWIYHFPVDWSVGRAR